MARLLIVLIPLALLLAWLPQWWVRRTIERYQQPANRYNGTGAQFARELLDAEGLHDVGVEPTNGGDHYDPQTRTVRLTPPHHDNGSLAALTIAAHEVGHALQHRDAYRPLALRTQLVYVARNAQFIGAVAMFAIPMITLISRHPVPGVAFFLIGLLSMGTAALVHLVTLPTEFDASFNRAMPLLERRQALHSVDYPHARRLLKAAAMTYVAQSVMSLINVGAWLRFLMRR
ncbi:MAG: zinc metallopeptidase [Thioalkalivibrionaceae bacterium]